MIIDVLRHSRSVSKLVARDGNMFGPARTLLLITACISALPAATQAPPPTTAFDGTYAGVSAVSTRSQPGSHNRFCRRPAKPSALTISNGVIQSTGGDRWQGAVNPQGALVIRDRQARRVDGQIDPSGTITGQYPGPTCKTSFVWRKQPG